MFSFIHSSDLFILALRTPFRALTSNFQAIVEKRDSDHTWSHHSGWRLRSHPSWTQLELSLVLGLMKRPTLLRPRFLASTLRRTRRAKAEGLGRLTWAITLLPLLRRLWCQCSLIIGTDYQNTAESRFSDLRSDTSPNKAAKITN